jgi:hypothetical protein
MLILDKFGNKKEIINPMFVPRIGDRVDFGYDPKPEVVAVWWNFDENQVVISLK